MRVSVNREEKNSQNPLGILHMKSEITGMLEGNQNTIMVPWLEYKIYCSKRNKTYIKQPPPQEQRPQLFLPKDQPQSAREVLPITAAASPAAPTIFQDTVSSLGQEESSSPVFIFPIWEKQMGQIKCILLLLGTPQEKALSESVVAEIIAL